LQATTIQDHKTQGAVANKAKRRGCILILFILLLTHFFTFLPQVLAQLPRLQFQHVTVEQGLSHPSINEICEDSCGFMWFGASSGLNRFDGKEIKSLDLPAIHALCTGTNGDVWVGTSTGGLSLSCISVARDTIIPYRLAVYGGGVRAIVNDPDSSLWIGTDIGLFHMDPRSGKFNRMGTEGLADLGVNSIADDGRGNLWLVTRGKIVRFEKATQKGQFVCNRPGNWHSSTSLAPDGAIWIAGGIHGRLLRIDPKSMRLDSTFKGGPRFLTTTVTIDASGIVYVGTDGEGMKIYDPVAKSWETYRHRASDPFSIADDHINSIVLDKCGNIWIGTQRGISWASRWRRRFSVVSIEDENKGDPRPGEVRDIAEDEDGNLWLGTAGGLKKWDRKHGTVEAVKVASNRINALQIVQRDQLWIGMSGGEKLLRLTIGRRNNVRKGTLPPLPKIQGRVTTMFKDGDTTIWLGCTRSKLFRYDLRTGHAATYTYETPEELFPGRVAFQGDDCPRMIYRDRERALWIATSWGVLKLDEQTGRLKRFLHSEPRSFQENMWCIYEDTRGNFWVGTDLGLELFDRAQGVFHPVIRTLRRLQGRTVAGILGDQSGALWMQTDGELLRYHQSTGEIKHYGASDGYPITTLGTFFTLGNRARCITRAGEFVFGIKDGIVLFRPEEIVDNPNKPHVAIAEVELLGGAIPRNGSWLRNFVPPRQPLRLSADENALEFKFAALDFTMPRQNKYAVWLEPADLSWSYLGTENSVRFVNLPSGSYRLRVKAANNDSVWSATEATFDFRIYPPWWKSLWAYIGYVLVFGLVLYMIYRARIARLNALERLRLNIAGDLHDEIGTGLSSIALQTELLSRTARSATEQENALAEIVKTARTLADSTRDVVWVLAPQHERLSDLVLKMRTEAPRALAVEDPAFEEHLEHPEVILSTEARKHVLMMYKEILHNIQRHAHAERVSIEVTEQQGIFELIAKDSGVGFVPETANCGHGLKNLHFRAKELGGTLTIASIPGKGTTVQFSVELTRLRD